MTQPQAGTQEFEKQGDPNSSSAPAKKHFVKKVHDDDENDPQPAICHSPTKKYLITNYMNTKKPHPLEQKFETHVHPLEQNSHIQVIPLE